MIKRWPIIRHIRWVYLSCRVEQHYRAWAKMGSLPSYRYKDDEILDRIWRGQE